MQLENFKDKEWCKKVENPEMVGIYYGGKELAEGMCFECTFMMLVVPQYNYNPEALEMIIHTQGIIIPWN